jgi:hypothetical protein
VNQVIDPMEAEPLDAIPVDSGPGRTVVVIATWVGVGLVAVFVLWFFWTNVISSDGGSLVDRYASGDTGVLYESLRDQMKMELPTQPTRHEVPDPNGSTVSVVSTPGSDYQFSVTRQPQSGDALETYTPILDAAAGSLAQQAGGEIVSQTKAVPLVDVAVKDVTFKKGDEYYRNRLVLANDRLYTVQAKVKGDDAAPFNRLWKTFEILGPR